MNTLTFAGTNLATFGVHVSGYCTHGAPQRDQTYLTVPGRNRQLLLDNGRFEDIQVAYDAFIIGNTPAELSDKLQALRGFLGAHRGYQRIEDTYHPDEYRIGAFDGPFSPDVSANRCGASFVLSFNCGPQRFLKDVLNRSFVAGNADSTFTLDNPEQTVARPLIRVYGTGRIAINGVYINILANSAYTDIDCETMDAFEGSTNRNNDIQIEDGGEFPTLAPGNNAIYIQRNGVTSLDVTPRWWRL